MKYTPMGVLLTQDSFSLHKVVANLPTDPASVFVFLLLAVAVGWIAWVSRKRGKQP